MLLHSFKKNITLKESEKKVLVAQSCPTLCNSMDCSPSGSSVHGILQERVLEWVAIPFSRGSSWPRDWTWISCIAGRFFNRVSHQQRRHIQSLTILRCWKLFLIVFLLLYYTTQWWKVWIPRMSHEWLNWTISIVPGYFSKPCSSSHSFSITRGVTSAGGWLK